MVRKLILFTALAFGPVACGVKGDPLPPLKPANIGRGRPTYKRASEKIQINERIGEGAKPMPATPGKIDGEDDE